MLCQCWGVETKLTKAKEWYEKAACQGYEPAKEKMKSHTECDKKK